MWGRTSLLMLGVAGVIMLGSSVAVSTFVKKALDNAAENARYDLVVARVDGRLAALSCGGRQIASFRTRIYGDTVVEGKATGPAAGRDLVSLELPTAGYEFKKRRDYSMYSRHQVFAVDQHGRRFFSAPTFYFDSLEEGHVRDSLRREMTIDQWRRTPDCVSPRPFED